MVILMGKRWWKYDSNRKIQMTMEHLLEIILVQFWDIPCCSHLFSATGWSNGFTVDCMKSAFGCIWLMGQNGLRPQERASNTCMFQGFHHDHPRQRVCRFYLYISLVWYYFIGKFHGKVWFSQPKHHRKSWLSSRFSRILKWRYCTI
jgi:hypothetical protein